MTPINLLIHIPATPHHVTSITMSPRHHVIPLPPAALCLHVGEADVVVLDHRLVRRGAGLLGGVHQFLLLERGELGPVAGSTMPRLLD